MNALSTSMFSARGGVEMTPNRKSARHTATQSVAGNE